MQNLWTTFVFTLFRQYGNCFCVCRHCRTNTTYVHWGVIFYSFSLCETRQKILPKARISYTYMQYFSQYSFLVLLFSLFCKYIHYTYTTKCSWSSMDFPLVGAMNFVSYDYKTFLKFYEYLSPTNYFCKQIYDNYTCLIYNTGTKNRVLADIKIYWNNINKNENCWYIYL